MVVTTLHRQVQLPNSRGRLLLDAALWCRTTYAAPVNDKMDIALEWEWDNNKVFGQFPFGDFRKLLEVDAACGLAIIQTRVDGRRGDAQAEETLERLCTSF